MLPFDHENEHDAELLAKCAEGLNANGTQANDKPASDVEPSTRHGDNKANANVDGKPPTELSTNAQPVDFCKPVEAVESDEYEETEEIEERLATFDEEIYKVLPQFLQKVTAKAESAEERDLLLLGSLAVISAALPNVYGVHDGREVFPNLFLFLTARASAGKSRLTLTKKIVEPIHRDLLRQENTEREKYLLKLAKCKAAKTEIDIQEPPSKMFIIPADSSKSSLTQVLHDNDGVGLCFETESDTLCNALKSDYGKFSDSLRKAAHHETISLTRKKNREHVEIEKPQLSVVLSGTPDQVQKLFPIISDGLFSRFAFYRLNVNLEWRNVFSRGDNQILDRYFEYLGDEFFEYYKDRKKLKEPSEFSLTEAQRLDLDTHFAQVYSQYVELFGPDFHAVVCRQALTTYRIAMVLSTMRIMETKRYEKYLICSDTDMHTALNLTKILIQHTGAIFNILPVKAETPKKHLTKKQELLKVLPAEFSRQDYINASASIGVHFRTVDTWIRKFEANGTITRLSQGIYRQSKK